MATIKQQKAFTFLSENIRSPKPIPLGEILIQSGYSVEVSKKPKLVTKSKGFQELLEEAGVTDDKLSKILDDGLNAMTYVKTERVEGIGKNRIKTEEIKGVPNDMIRHKYLETALKLKGHTAAPEQDDRKAGDTYNTFVQNNQVNLNTPRARQLADESLKILMEKTKRPIVDITPYDPS